jgi:hypothetical protein
MSERKRTGIAAGAGAAAIFLIFGGTASALADGASDFLIQRLSYDTFKETIYDLQAFETRYWDREGNEKAVQYIKDKLESFGYDNVVLDEYTYSGVTMHNIYATKVGHTRPLEMYIIGAHMDSFNIDGDYDHCPGADDDGSGTASVLETARVLSEARTDTSVRFCLWNNEETGLDGSRAYVRYHRQKQGSEEEPTWLGMIQQDMILYDHGPGEEPDADVEYQKGKSYDGKAKELAEFVANAMSCYGDIPAEVGDNMNYTDSASFWNWCPAISCRENQRVAEIGRGSNPHWHKTTDNYDTYTEEDYTFGFNIVKMVTGAVGDLAGAALVGDVNCDTEVDGDDIPDFVQALVDPEGYDQSHPECDRIKHADIDGDGDVSFDDIDPFVGLLTG